MFNLKSLNFKSLRKYLSDNKVEKKYVSAGAIFGEAVACIYMGECVGFSSYLDKWADWEHEYSNRGFRTISLDDFVDLGGYGKSIDSLLRIKRADDEKPIYHAQIYKENFLGKIAPAIDLGKVMKGEVQMGTYILPSTKTISASQ